MKGEGCYTIFGFKIATYLYCTHLVDELYSGKCGRTNASSLHDAIKKAASCEINGHY